jgi:hypothetical protein
MRHMQGLHGPAHLRTMDGRDRAPHLTSGTFYKHRGYLGEPCRTPLARLWSRHSPACSAPRDEAGRASFSHHTKRKRRTLVDGRVTFPPIRGCTAPLRTLHDGGAVLPSPRNLSHPSALERRVTTSSRWLSLAPAARSRLLALSRRDRRN